MIKSICLLTDPKVLLSCNGKKFQALGSSSIAQSIRDSMENEEGAFYQFMKKPKEDFDPVYYWYTSSMNFADETPPKPYSEELFELLKEELSMLEKDKS